VEETRSKEDRRQELFAAECSPEEDQNKDEAKGGDLRVGDATLKAASKLESSLGCGWSWSNSG